MEVQCDAVDRYYGVQCQRPKGHTGFHTWNEEHKGVQWPQSECAPKPQRSEGQK